MHVFTPFYTQDLQFVTTLESLSDLYVTYRQLVGNNPGKIK